MKKILTLLVSLTFLLSACGKQQQIDNRTELEFWTLQLASFDTYINNIISEYEKTHPNIKVKWVDVPFSEGEKRALAAVMSRNVPDVINMNPSFASTLASRGALVDIKKYITKEDYKQYLEQAWQASSLNGRVFGVPWYITSALTIYNKDILAKSGISTSKIYSNYYEIAKIAPIIKQKTGKYAFMPTLSEDGKMLKMFNKYDIPIVNDDKTKAVFNTQKATDVLSFWVDLYNEKLIPPESLTQGHRAALEKFQAGETAFIVVGANFLKIIQENSPVIFKNIDVSSQVTGSNGKVDFSLMNLVVPKKSDNKKEAVEFALFVTNAMNQLEFCKLAPILPSSNEALSSDYFSYTEDDMLSKARNISAKQLKNALVPLPTLENQKDLYQIIDNETQAALLKEKTPQKALDDAVKKWNELLVR